MSLKVLCIKIEEDDKRLIEYIARSKDKTVSELMREIINLYIIKNHNKVIKTKRVKIY